MSEPGENGYRKNNTQLYQDESYLNSLYRTNIGSLILDLEPLIKKLSASKIPQGIKCQSISSIWFDDIALVCKEQFDIEKKETLSRLRGNNAIINYDSVLSQTVIKDGSAAGYFLIFPDQDRETAFAHAVVVKKQYRNSWVTPLLKFNTFKMLGSYNYKWLKYYAYKQNRDTINHARKLDSQVISV